MSYTVSMVCLYRPVAEDPNQSSKPQKPEHCLLLQKAIPRGGLKPKTSKRTTLDVLVEFGLLVCLVLCFIIWMLSVFF